MQHLGVGPRRYRYPATSRSGQKSFVTDTRKRRFGRNKTQNGLFFIQKRLEFITFPRIRGEEPKCLIKHRTYKGKEKEQKKNQKTESKKE